MRGGSHFYGEMRHYRASEDLYIGLYDSSFNPYTSGTTSNVQFHLVFPDGTTFNKFASGAEPASTFTHIGTGLYRVKLWGDGTGGGYDVDLAQVGRVGIRVIPTAAAFEELCGWFIVKPDFDVKLAMTYSAGTAGTDQITGCLSFYRWWSHEKVTNPKTLFLATEQIKIYNSAGTTLVTVSDSDFVQSGVDNNLYFTKTIAGIAGATVLTARVTATYKGFTLSHDFPLVARFAA